MAEFIYYNANKCWTSATTEVNATGNLVIGANVGSPGTNFTAVSAADFVALIAGGGKKNHRKPTQLEI